jgi:hypothetical protein
MAIAGMVALSSGKLTNLTQSTLNLDAAEADEELQRSTFANGLNLGLEMC